MAVKNIMIISIALLLALIFIFFVPFTNFDGSKFLGSWKCVTPGYGAQIIDIREESGLFLLTSRSPSDMNDSFVSVFTLSLGRLRSRDYNSKFGRRYYKYQQFTDKLESEGLKYHRVEGNRN